MIKFIKKWIEIIKRYAEIILIIISIILTLSITIFLNKKINEKKLKKYFKELDKLINIKNNDDKKINNSGYKDFNNDGTIK